MKEAANFLGLVLMLLARMMKLSNQRAGDNIGKNL